ncbi:inorganic phosphate transporter [Frigoriglobus tundricola]|uniref:Phosphate transporter n=1 Tax=Frigoriglobus tundricola TaxID=2774151 RepID=A0A6M5YU24_9BACT|nr:inorganic phosphate transporter [Frigoriglobus tundricola]QJW96860.1 Low-affinity inorganic phosphate transporter [Frigoriglobus tundricola]
MNFWTAVGELSTGPFVFLTVALLIALAFEFINGFHDTANAVTTVIYTRTLSATPAVVYSGLMNFAGALITVLFFGAAVAFSIVNLLPVDLLVDANSDASLVMVLALLIAGVIWNLGTWSVGLPVSSSHTLIGSILGVGIANGLWTRTGLAGVNWAKAGEVAAGLLLSPVLGFLAAAGLLLAMRRVFKEPKLYEPPEDGDRPPRWVRVVLLGTCGAVSFAHGSNDGQKGMGLLLLVLIGFMPVHYALNVNDPEMGVKVSTAAGAVREAYARYDTPVPAELDTDLKYIAERLRDQPDLSALAGTADADASGNRVNSRWEVRQAIFRTNRELKRVEKAPEAPEALRKELAAIRETRLAPAIEFVPIWVVVCTALALGIGTCVGYKRIVVTVAEKIGKSHLTYAQGAAAEAVAAATILAADVAHLPVSTTHVLSSGVAGTMAASGAGVQGGTCRKIFLAWVLTLPASAVLAGALFTLGRLVTG